MSYQMRRQHEGREEHLFEEFERQQSRTLERVRNSVKPSRIPHKNTFKSSLFAQGKNNNAGGGKVRQMFDEVRRHRAGIDRGYPLEPIKGHTKKIQQKRERTIEDMMQKHNLIEDDDTIEYMSTVPTRLSNIGSRPNKNLSSPTNENENSEPIPPKPVVKTKKQPIVKRVVRPTGATAGVAPDAPAGPERTDLRSCQYCTRRFASDRIQVHEAICKKTGRKKRRTYDASKHRVAGTELDGFVRGGPIKKGGGAAARRAPKPAPKRDWRKSHDEFISTIRSAKAAQAHLDRGGKLSDLPPPPPSSYDDYVQCPHCNRRFNQAAAERHIPKCADYLHNKPKPNAPNQHSKIGGKLSR